MKELEAIIIGLGIFFAVFVILPWLFMIIVGFIKSFWDENNRFDG
tara:strand:- start:362 stop:496 length:135 start_codon:yes stop_codon:yes gene_type:complete